MEPATLQYVNTWRRINIVKCSVIYYVHQRSPLRFTPPLWKVNITRLCNVNNTTGWRLCAACLQLNSHVSISKEGFAYQVELYNSFPHKGGMCVTSVWNSTYVTARILSWAQPEIWGGNSHQSRSSPDLHIPYGPRQSSAGTYFGCVILRWFSLRYAVDFCVLQD